MPAGQVHRPQVRGAAPHGRQGASGEPVAQQQGASGDEGDHGQARDQQHGGVGDGPAQQSGVVAQRVVVVLGAGGHGDRLVPSRAVQGGGVAAEQVGHGLGELAQRHAARHERPDRAVGAAASPAPSDPGPQQPERHHEEHRGDGRRLVEGVGGLLGDQVGEHAQGRGEGVAQQRGQHRPRGQVGEEDVEGVAPVDAARVVAGGVDAAPTACGGLGVVGDGVGDDEDPVARAAHPPAEVDVVAEQSQGAVESAEFLPHVPADQHAGAGDREDLAGAVVLSVVELRGLQSGLPASRAVDGDADLHQESAVEPVAELGAQDGGAGVVVGRGEEPGEGVRFGGAVVVDQPDPLDAPLAAGEPGTGAGVVQGRLDGLPVTGVAGQGEDRLGVDVLGEDGAAAVTASGVHSDDPLHRPGLGADRFQRLGQPAGAVVGDDDGGDDVPGGIEG